MSKPENDRSAEEMAKKLCACNCDYAKTHGGSRAGHFTHCRIFLIEDATKALQSYASAQVEKQKRRDAEIVRDFDLSFSVHKYRVDLVRAIAAAITASEKGEG